MEGIELEAEGIKDETESELTAFEVSKSKVRWCSCGDGESEPHLDPLQIQLIIVCLLLVLYALYCHAQEYDNDLDFRLAIHYAQCM
eukprot:3938524-Rhodomonas_salina.1